MSCQLCAGLLLPNLLLPSVFFSPPPLSISTIPVLCSKSTNKYLESLTADSLIIQLRIEQAGASQRMLSSSQNWTHALSETAYLGPPPGAAVYSQPPGRVKVEQFQLSQQCCGHGKAG